MILMGSFQLEMFYDILLYSTDVLEVKVVIHRIAAKILWPVDAQVWLLSFFPNDSKKENTFYKAFMDFIIFLMLPFTWA